MPLLKRGELAAVAGSAPFLQLSAVIQEPDAKSDGLRADRPSRFMTVETSARQADVLLIDAPFGGSQPDALTSIKNGDVTAGVACFTAGIPRYIGRSRCTPPPARLPVIVENRTTNTYAAPDLLH